MRFGSCAEVRTARASLTRLAALALALLAPAAAAAQTGDQPYPPGPRAIRLGGDIVATFGPRDSDAFFNYTDYERNALRIVRDSLEANPAHIPKVAAARFIGFGDAGHRIEIHTRLQCEDYLQGLLLQEELLLDILKKLEAEGITLDLPQHVVLQPGEVPAA